MARKTLEVQIVAEGRDKGKLFLLTELPPLQAEKWATRAFLALSRSGVDIPEDVAASGMAGFALVALKALAGVSFQEAEPLLDDMLKCVQIYPNPSNKDTVRALNEEAGDIEEVETLFRLRKELVTLHTGFSFPVAVPKLES